MRSLESTGIGMLPFARPRDLLAIPLELTNARHRPGTRPNGEPVINVAFTLRRLYDLNDQVVVNEYAEEIPDAFVCTLESNEGRDQFVEYFAAGGESVGPVEWSQLPSKNGNSGAYILLPYQEYQEPAAPPVVVPQGRSVQQAISGPTTRPASQNGRSRATAAQVSRIDRSQTVSAQQERPDDDPSF